MPTKKETIFVHYDENAQEWLMGKDVGRLELPPNYPKLEVPVDYSGEFTFKIHNTPLRKFGADAFAPKGTGNPSDFDYQFSESVKENGKTLIVTSKNTSEQGGEYPQTDYTYQLNFDDRTTLDPILTNMGCCQRSSADYAVYAIGIAAVAAAYFLIIRPWMARRSANPNVASKAKDNEPH